MVMVPCSVAKEDCGEESENGCWRTAGSNGKTDPLDDFSKEIGCSDVLEQSTDRHFVPSFSRFAQVNQLLVCCVKFVIYFLLLLKRPFFINVPE
jgi:hypothetical protein